MPWETSHSIQIDLDQFKLYLNIPDVQAITLHFDTPSRRFYLSLMALVAEEMKKSGIANLQGLLRRC